MTKRVAVGQFMYEGNSFSPREDGRAEFVRSMLAEGESIWPLIEGRAVSFTGAVDCLRDAGFSVLPTVAVKGVPGGCVVDAFYQEVRASILDRIKALGVVDGVYLSLHGAMICQSVDDPEGDLLSAVREIIGPNVPMAVSLDLHAHVTPAMCEAADILVGYETYPHEDAYTTGTRAASLLGRAMRGEVRPVMRLRRIRAILPVLGGSTRDGAPMAQVREMARKMEREGRALSVSYFPVQPWLDLPEVGIAGLAITDGDAEGAHTAATEIAAAMWERRSDFELPLFSADEAVRRALSLDCKTTLIVDATDSVGGGACGDSPLVLGALLRNAADVDCAVCLVDAPAVQACMQAREKATVRLRLGATLDARHLAPVEIHGTVESLHDGRFVYRGGPTAGALGNMGPTAVVRVGGIRIVIVSTPFYEFGDEHYRACRIVFDSMRIAVFKNLMNFRTLLARGIDWVGVDGPGATPPRLDTLVWKRKVRPFWPLDDFEVPPFMDEQHNGSAARG